MNGRKYDTDAPRNTGTDTRTLLSRDDSHALKGIFAVCVLFHHLWQWAPPVDAVLLQLLIGSWLGTLSVGVFLFISGYGLITSCEVKGKDYIRRLPKERILPFYLLDVLLILLYTVLGLALGWPEVTPGLILRSFLIGGTVIKNGWYVQAALCLYVLFAAVFSLPLSRKGRTAVLSALVMAVWLICLLLPGGRVSGYLYQALPAFPVGMFWAAHRGRIGTLISRRGRFLLIWACGVSVCAASALGASLVPDTTPVPVLLRSVTIVLFVLLCVSGTLILPKCLYCNRVTSFLGGISFGLYVTQGMFIGLFSSGPLRIGSVSLFWLAVVLCTFPASWLFSRVERAFYHLFRKSRASGEKTAP